MRCASLLALALLAACHHGSAAHDMATTADLASVDLASTDDADLAFTVPAGDNVVPIIVDEGPPELTATSVNVPFISITICVPGTSTCQTIDHVSVDTGSVGLRVLASSLSDSMMAALPAAKDGGGNPLAECYGFADGYVWGSVRTADLTIGGEKATNLPFQIIADPSAGAAPSNCSDTGTPQQTLDAFGSRALIGLGLFVSDCGSDCEDAANFGDGYEYYACPTPTACMQVVLPEAQQVQNPAALMPDNNGVIVQLPAIPDSGDKDTAGALIFGIGTRSNNMIPSSASLLAVDRSNDGSFSVSYKGATYGNGYIDSGSNDISFGDDSITVCTGSYPDYYCPASALVLTADNLDQSSNPHTVTFHVADASTLLASDNTAFADLVSPSGDTTTFAWGLPFFFGRSVYTAIEGRSTPAGDGPYYAY